MSVLVFSNGKATILSFSQIYQCYKTVFSNFQLPNFFLPPRPLLPPPGTTNSLGFGSDTWGTVSRPADSSFPDFMTPPIFGLTNPGNLNLNGSPDLSDQPEKPANLYRGWPWGSNLNSSKLKSFNLFYFRFL
jgi:hypothetical protein